MPIFNPLLSSLLRQSALEAAIAVAPYVVPRGTIPGNITPPEYETPRGTIPGNIGPLPPPPPPPPQPQQDLRRIINPNGVYFFVDGALRQAASASGSSFVGASGWLAPGMTVIVLQKGGDPLGRGMWLVQYNNEGMSGWMFFRQPGTNAQNLTGAP